MIDHFFASSLLLFKFKGIIMKLKNVACAISVEWLIIAFFVDVIQRSYKPLNFARAILPYAAD